MSVKIAILSDLHCHYGDGLSPDTILRSNASRFPANQHPVQSLLERISSDGLKADILLMPGDLTNKANDQGIQSGWAFVHEIKSALGAKVLAPTVGNHDVVLDGAPDPFTLVKGLFPHFPTDDANQNDEFWSKGLTVVESTHCQVLIVNSAQHFKDRASAKKGLVIDAQLADLNAKLKMLPKTTFRIAVVHHHPMLHEDIGLGTDDVLQNGSLLTAMLEDFEFVLLVHGHKHHPKLSYAPGGKMIVMAAGSFSAGLGNGLGSRTRNLFHLIELHDDLPGGGGQGGTVESWKFQYCAGWNRTSEYSEDMPFRCGFGNKTPATTLADRIDSAMKTKRKRHIEFRNLNPIVPEVQYLTPGQLRNLVSELKSRGIGYWSAGQNEALVARIDL